MYRGRRSGELHNVCYAGTLYYAFQVKSTRKKKKMKITDYLVKVGINRIIYILYR